MHAIHDLINTTAASESTRIRLPEEFYDAKVRDIVDNIAFEEEYSAFHESPEMRQVGIGGLLGDVVERLVFDAEKRTIGPGNKALSGPSPKLFLAGSHDSTLGAIMSSLGLVDPKARRKWPPYGSVLAVELFHDSAESDRDEAKNESISDSSLIGRTPAPELNPEQMRRLEHHYVRVRYNGQSLVVPGCRETGRNWRGNESFCTLVSILYPPREKI